MKKINKELLRNCIKNFDFAIDRYNYFIYEDDRYSGYEEINNKDLMNFIKKEKKHTFFAPIYSEKEHEPKILYENMIESIDYQIWTNGCYPYVKILPPFFKDDFNEFATIVKMPGKRKLKSEYPFYVWEYNEASDYYGGSHSYGYDPTHVHTTQDILKDVYDFIYQLMCAKVDKETRKMYIAKEE